jgi:hypothetical protein
MVKLFLSLVLIVCLSSNAYAQDFSRAVRTVKNRVKWEIAHRTPPEIRGIVYAITSAIIDAIPDKFDEVDKKEVSSI